MNKGRVQKIQDVSITKSGGSVMGGGTGGGAIGGRRRKAGGLPNEIKIGDDLLSENEKEYIRSNSSMKEYSIQDLVWNIENMLIPYLELQNSDKDLNGIAENDFSQKHPDGVGEDDLDLDLNFEERENKGFFEKFKDKIINFFR